MLLSELFAEAVSLGAARSVSRRFVPLYRHWLDIARRIPADARSRNGWRLFYRLQQLSEQAEKPQAPEEVRKLAARLGWDDVDWLAGHFVRSVRGRDGKRREVRQRISKALTEAVRNGFVDEDTRTRVLRMLEQDKSRSGASASRQGQVRWMVVSFHPLDIAGGTHGRGWYACTDFFDDPSVGSDQTDDSIMLRTTLRANTIVAYEIAEHDRNLQCPVARVFIHPVVERDGTLSFMPDLGAYGQASQAFLAAVRKWSRENTGRFRAPAALGRRDTVPADVTGLVPHDLAAAIARNDVDEAIDSLIALAERGGAITADHLFLVAGGSDIDELRRVANELVDRPRLVEIVSRRESVLSSDAQILLGLLGIEPPQECGHNCAMWSRALRAARGEHLSLEDWEKLVSFLSISRADLFPKPLLRFLSRVPWQELSDFHRTSAWERLRAVRDVVPAELVVADKKGVDPYQRATVYKRLAFLPRNRAETEARRRALSPAVVRFLAGVLSGERYPGDPMYEFGRAVREFDNRGVTALNFDRLRSALDRAETEATEADLEEIRNLHHWRGILSSPTAHALLVRALSSPGSLRYVIARRYPERADDIVDLLRRIARLLGVQP